MTCFGQLNNSLINDMSPYMICPCSESAEEGKLGSGLLCSKCLSAVAGTTCMQYIYTDTSITKLTHQFCRACKGNWVAPCLCMPASIGTGCSGDTACGIVQAAPHLVCTVLMAYRSELAESTW